MPNDLPDRGERMTGIVAAGTPERLESGRPLRLDGYDGVFLVKSGYVDLFAVAAQDGEVLGARRHILRIDSAWLSPFSRTSRKKSGTVGWAKL